MDAINVIETRKTPKVSFDSNNGRLEISGHRSMPEVALEFYQPMLKWVKAYTENPVSSSTMMSVKLEYCNTSSGKCILNMLKDLDYLAQKGHLVIIKWYYEEEDEDMLLTAEDMNSSLQHIEIEKIAYN